MNTAITAATILQRLNGSSGGGVPFTLTNNNNLRLAAGVLRPDGASGGGAAVTWVWLLAGGHAFDFFTSTISISDGSIIVNHPVITKLHAFNIKTDETLANSNIFVEAELISTTQTKITIYQQVGMMSGYAIGNGTNWDLVGDLSNFDIISNTISTLSFNPPKPYSNSGNAAQNSEYWGSAIGKYAGSTIATSVSRNLSPGGGASFEYTANSAGVPIVANSSADIIEIITNTPKVIKINASPNDANGWPGANIFTASSNFWVNAFYEI